jgi:serine protease
MAGLRRRFSISILVALALACTWFGGANTASSVSDIQGDADCSGQANALDGVSILKQTAGLGFVGCRNSADVNCDSAVDARDMVTLLGHTIGLGDGGFPACTPIGQSLGNTTVALNASLESAVGPDLPGLNGGPARPVASAQGPDGVKGDFVAGEIVIKPENDAELQGFLARYDGTVLKDGASNISEALGDVGVTGTHSSGNYLVQVDLSTSTLDDLIANMAKAHLLGRFQFSDENAARLFAILVRETDLTLELNTVAHPDTSNEVPLNAMHDAWQDAEQFLYMRDTGGLSIGVAKAWDYLKYNLIPPDNGTFTPVRVGIVDSGFALGSDGKPLEGNPDYYYFGPKPLQWDESDDDGNAGGESGVSCSGGSSCPWHGSGSFGVCCARPHNNFGTAGTGGDVVIPVFIKVDSSFYTIAGGIEDAAVAGSQVITISMGGECGFWCGLGPQNEVEEAVDYAVSQGAVVLAAAGNDKHDISDIDFYPCKVDKVICVGAINDDRTNESNWGSGVDIWAPHNVFSTVTPLSEAADDNDFGLDELYHFGGTSAATPFVAGIVAMLKALHSNLQWDDIQDVLQSTAMPGADTRVSKGYVDALAAVMAVQPNGAPAVTIKQPLNGSTHSYHNLLMRVTIRDVEAGANLSRFDGETLVKFYDNHDLFLCETNIITYRNNESGYECTAATLVGGVTSIRAEVTDPFGAVGTNTANVTITNTPPSVNIVTPPVNSTFYETQTIKFSATVFDPDEDPFPAGGIKWESDIGGVLGYGTIVRISLPQGTHHVTVTASDDNGLTTTKSITVVVQSGAGIPTAHITAPADGAFLGAGSNHFSGNASDPEDGSLHGTSLEWRSDVDGFLGYGEELDANLTGATNCQQGVQDHVITLTAIDSDGHHVTDQINVEVGIIC